MRIARMIIGALLLIAGGVWFLQGINVIPGSFIDLDLTADAPGDMGDLRRDHSFRGPHPHVWSQATPPID